MVEKGFSNNVKFEQRSEWSGPCGCLVVGAVGQQEQVQKHWRWGWGWGWGRHVCSVGSKKPVLSTDNGEEWWGMSSER